MFDELRAGIRRREGIIVLTGEPGTGKTTLCRSVLAALDRKTFCAFVPDPFVSREDLLKMLLIEFGVMSVDDVKSGRLHAATRPELSYPLYDFLRSLVPLQAYAVLIIDEAQNLSSQLLEEIRILADLEGPEKLLQLVLVGQPELRDKLKDPAMRQVDQRVSVRCSLQPLERDAVPEYIAHRLTVAGGGADRVEFTPEALDLLFQRVERKSSPPQSHRRQVAASRASRPDLDHHAGDRRPRRSAISATRSRRRAPATGGCRRRADDCRAGRCPSRSMPAPVLVIAPQMRRRCRTSPTRIRTSCSKSTRRRTAAPATHRRAASRPPAAAPRRTARDWQGSR